MPNPVRKLLLYNLSSLLVTHPREDNYYIFFKAKAATRS